MLPYLRTDLTDLHLQQLHLNIDDGGSSLPDMRLIQQCAYTASFTQCLPSVLEVLNLISPISLQDILTSYDTYQAPPLPSSLPFYQLHTSFRDYFDSVAQLHSQHADLSLTAFLHDHCLNPSSNTSSVAFATFAHLQHSSVHCLYSMTLSALPITTLFLARIHLVGSM